MMSLVKQDSKNAGTITATVAKMAPFINTGTINSVFGSGIARYSSSCFFLAHRALAALRAILHNTAFYARGCYELGVTA